jgi:hypothetical protein
MYCGQNSAHQAVSNPATSWSSVKTNHFNFSDFGKDSLADLSVVLIQTIYLVLVRDDVIHTCNLV